MIPKDILPEEYGGTAGKLQEFHGELCHFTLNITLI